MEKRKERGKEEIHTEAETKIHRNHPSNSKPKVKGLALELAFLSDMKAWLERRNNKMGKGSRLPDIPEVKNRGDSVTENLQGMVEGLPRLKRPPACHFLLIPPFPSGLNLATKGTRCLEALQT